MQFEGSLLKYNFAALYMNRDTILETALRTIQLEAESVNGLKEYINDHFARAVEAVFSCKGRLVVSGVGKSAIIAQKIVATFNSTGTPSLYIDVFVRPGASRPDAESWTKIVRSFSQELLDGGEQRFPYIRLRDRAAENDEAA